MTVLRHLSSCDPIQTNTAVPSKQPSTSTQKPTRSSIQSMMELEKNKTTAVAANAKAVRTRSRFASNAAGSLEAVSRA